MIAVADSAAVQSAACRSTIYQRTTRSAIHAAGNSPRIIGMVFLLLWNAAADAGVLSPWRIVCGIQPGFVTGNLAGRSTN